MFHGRAPAIASIARVMIPLAALLLQACGSSEEEEAAATPIAETEYDVELTGSVGDGPIVNASIRVFANDGTVLDTTLSSQSAGYNIQLRTKGKYYPLTIDAHGGTDLATNTAPGFTLATASTEPRKRSVANINPFTTLAISLARQMNGGLDTNNISSALGTVMAQLNTGLTSTLSVDPMTTEIDDSNLAEIVKASEALAEIFRRTHAGLGRSGVTIDSVIDMIAADLIDGTIDGSGAASADRRVAALTVIASAEVMLEAMVNRLEVDGVDVTPTLDGIVVQLATGSGAPGTATRPVTTQMLALARRGIIAAIALGDSASLQTLAAALDSVSAGMTSAQAAQLLPTAPSAALAPALTSLATASDAEITAVIDGTSPPPAPAPAPAPTPPANSAPLISGAPASSVLQDVAYAFTPTASDPDNDALTFSITSRPAWASFSTASGALTGTPTAADIGSYTGILITVSDGTDTAQLGPFSITVQPAALGSATLSWVAPTANSDGTPLTNLAGYKVYWGQQSGNYSASTTIMNPGITNYVVDQLTPGTYFFTVTALNDVSVESSLSNEASKTIN